MKILILKKITVYTARFPSDEEDGSEDDDDDENETDIRQILELAKPCLGHFKQFAKSFAKCIRITKLKNHLIFGLDSYADTAKYIGYIWSILIILNGAHENARLSAEPSFNGSILDAKGENELDINLLKLIGPAIRLISKKEVRQLIKGVINGQAS